MYNWWHGLTNWKWTIGKRQEFWASSVVHEPHLKLIFSNNHKRLWYMPLWQMFITLSSDTKRNITHKRCLLWLLKPPATLNLKKMNKEGFQVIKQSKESHLTVSFFHFLHLTSKKLISLSKVKHQHHASKSGIMLYYMWDYLT